MKPLRRINAKERYKRKTEFSLETKEHKLMPFASCEYKLSFLKNKIVQPTYFKAKVHQHFP